MKKTTIKISVIILTLTLFAACKKGDTGATGPAGATGPNLSGTLQGFVQLYDQYGYRIYTNLDSTSVTIGAKTVLTDSTGKYSFTLTTGTYDAAVASQPNGNFGGTVTQGIQFTGGGIVDRDIAISQMPGFTLTALAADDTLIGTNHWVKIWGSVNSIDTKPRALAVFYNSASPVSASTNQYLFAYDANNPVIAANASTFSFLLKSSTVYQSTGLAPGQTAYIAVYPAAVSWNNTSNYLDYANDKKVYNAIGSAPMTASLVMQ